MTFPPCFAPTSPRRISLDRRGNSIYDGSGIGKSLSRHQDLYQDSSSSSSIPLLNALVPAPFTMVARSATPDGPRSATPDQYNSYNYGCNGNINGNINGNSNPTEDEYQDSPHRMQEELKQDSEEDDDGHAALILLGLSRIVSNEILSDSNCMKKESISNHQESNPVPRSSTNNEFSPQANAGGSNSGPFRGVPESITVEYRDDSGNVNSNVNSNSNSNSNSHLIRVASDESMGITVAGPPVTVASSPSISSPSPPPSPPLPSFYSRTSTIDVLRARASSSIEQQRIRTVSNAAEDMAPARASSRGASTNEKALSPLLHPLSPSRDLSSLGIHENVSPRSRHLPRFRHPLFRKELELLEHQQKEEERKNEIRMAAAAVVITPIPKQPRPILYIGNHRTLGTYIAAKSANMNCNTNTNTNTNTNMNMNMNDFEDVPVPVPSTTEKRHAPLELPPLLLNINQNQNVHPNTQPNPEQPCRSSAAVAQRAASIPVSRITARNTKNPQAGTGTRSKKKASASSEATKKPLRHHQTGKKFSWKAYPELEDFLIINREEYLSFSARNYTIEQRDYNNRLTAKLLEHAAASGYPDLFNHCAFSAVRDRIRSYYKSYVQSFKRRKERQQQLRQKALEGNSAPNK